MKIQLTKPLIQRVYYFFDSNTRSLTDIKNQCEEHFNCKFSWEFDGEFSDDNIPNIIWYLNFQSSTDYEYFLVTVS